MLYGKKGWTRFQLIISHTRKVLSTANCVIFSCLPNCWPCNTPNVRNCHSLHLPYTFSAITVVIPRSVLTNGVGGRTLKMQIMSWESSWIFNPTVTAQSSRSCCHKSPPRSCAVLSTCQDILDIHNLYLTGARVLLIMNSLIARY